METTAKPKIYVESSTISYLTARPSQNIVVSAKQLLTYQWWNMRIRYDLFISETVIEEIGNGDPEAAKARLQMIEGIPLLEMNKSVVPLTHSLLRSGAVPIKSEADAVHIAYSAIYGMDFLITWNQKHIATEKKKRLVEEVIDGFGFKLPRLLTPEQHLIFEET